MSRDGKGCDAVDSACCPSISVSSVQPDLVSMVLRWGNSLSDPERCSMVGRASSSELMGAQVGGVGVGGKATPGPSSGGTVAHDSVASSSHPGGFPTGVL